MAITKLFFLVFFVGVIAECFAGIADLPAGISQQLYCEGCIATVKELKKSLSKRSRATEYEVMDAVENVCSPKNFVSYDYSPPKNVKACKFLIEQHEEDIENAFTKDIEDKETEICHSISEACKGVNRSSKPGDLSDIDLTVDGKGDKVTKQVVVDPTTGTAKVTEDESEEHNKKTKGTEKKKSKSDSSKKDKKKSKTLSKKDKKEKRVKNSKTSKAAKTKDKKTADDGIERLNIDINDPMSVENIVQQIKDISQKHSADVASKKKEEL